MARRFDRSTSGRPSAGPRRFRAYRSRVQPDRRSCHRGQGPLLDPAGGSRGLGDCYQAADRSAKASVGRDQDRVERIRQGDIQRVACRNPLQQRPCGQQQWLQRPTLRSEHGQQLDPVLLPGQSSFANKTGQGREDFSVQVRGRGNGRRGSDDAPEWTAAGKSQIKSTTVAASMTAVVNGRRARRPRPGSRRRARDPSVC